MDCRLAELSIGESRGVFLKVSRYRGVDGVWENPARLVVLILGLVVIV